MNGSQKHILKESVQTDSYLCILAVCATKKCSFDRAQPDDEGLQFDLVIFHFESSLLPFTFLWDPSWTEHKQGSEKTSLSVMISTIAQQSSRLEGAQMILYTLSLQS